MKFHGLGQVLIFKTDSNLWLLSSIVLQRLFFVSENLQTLGGNVVIALNVQ